MKTIGKQNKFAWETLYGTKSYDTGGCHLPNWGLYSIGSELTHSHLPIENRDVLELGCGLGESIPFIKKQGAKSITVTDFSKEALAIINDEQVSKKCFDFSKKFPFADNSFDTIFAIYSLGWSSNITKTLSEIYRVLRPGGTFMFSWDHQLSRVTSEEDGKILVSFNYHNHKKLQRENWRNTNQDITTIQLKPSEWFQKLTDVGFNVTGFWEPEVKTESVKEASDFGFSKNYSLNKSLHIPPTIIFKVTKPIN